MALFNPITVLSIFYLNILILCIQANPEFPDLQIHGQKNSTLLKQILKSESSKEVPEYEIVQLRILSQRNVDYQDVIRVYLSAFGKEIHLRLERNDDFDDRSKRVKFSKGSLTNNGVQLTEVNVEDDDPGIPYIDLAQMAAVTIRYGPDGELLMDGVIGDDFVIKPAPTDKYSGDSIAYDWDVSDDESNFDRFSTSAPIKGAHIVYWNARDLKSSFKVVDDVSRIDAFQHYRREHNRPLHAFPEVLLMVDYDSYAMHLSHGLNDVQIKRYYISFMNGVDLRYRILSDPKISLILSQIVIFKSRDDTPFLKNNLRYRDRDVVDAEFALRDVMLHMYKYREDYPDIDVAILLTKLDMCTKYLLFMCDENAIGLAQLRGACNINPVDKRWNGIAMVEDNGGFDGILTAAHEMAHLLGSGHDGTLVKTLPDDYSYCSVEDGYIMTTKLASNRLLEWSECSIKQFKWFLSSYEASCLFNQPSYRNKLDGSELPGVMLSLDEQCKRIFGTRANAWDSRVCVKLQCDEPIGNVTLKEMVLPPAAEGSSCGENLHCRDGKCVSKYQTYSRAWSVTPVHNSWEYIDSTTVGTTTELPRTTVSKIVFKTKLPRTKVTTLRTTTKLPRTTVSKIVFKTKLPRTKVTTLRTTTKLPRTKVTALRTTTKLPRTKVTTLRTTTKLSSTTVSKIGFKTKLPSTTVRTVSTTTGLPSTEGEKACIEEKEHKFCKIYFRIIGYKEACRNERMLEDCCYSHTIFCRVGSL